MERDLLKTTIENISLTYKSAWNEGYQQGILEGKRLAFKNILETVNTFKSNPDIKNELAADSQPKRGCRECLGKGRLYFKNLDDLVDYLRDKNISPYEALEAARQYSQNEDYISCPKCQGKGFQKEE